MGTSGKVDTFFIMSMMVSWYLWYCSSLVMWYVSLSSEPYETGMLVCDDTVAPRYLLKLVSICAFFILTDWLFWNRKNGDLIFWTGSLMSIIILDTRQDYFCILFYSTYIVIFMPTVGSWSFLTIQGLCRLCVTFDVFIYFSNAHLWLRFLSSVLFFYRVKNIHFWFICVLFMKFNLCVK